jgi:hypothetical protein
MLVGGFDGEYRNDVWVWKEAETDAGIKPYENPLCSRAWFGDWTMVSLAPWVGRYGFAILNLEQNFDPEARSDAIMVIGGRGQPGASSFGDIIVGRQTSIQVKEEVALLDDVWCYEHGKWTEVTPAAPWNPRSHLQAVRYWNDSFVVVGGRDASVTFSDTWRWGAEWVEGSRCARTKRAGFDVGACTTCTRLVDELNENLAALDVPEEYEAGAGAPIPIKGGGPAPLDQVKIKGDL